MSYSQQIGIEKIKEANRYMLHNLECQDILVQQDKIIDACDSSKDLLKGKLATANTLVKIHESINKGQEDVIKEKDDSLKKMAKTKKFWKRMSLVMIGENMIIGLFVYLTIAGI